MSTDRRSSRRRLSPLASLRALPDEFPRVVLVLAAGDLVASFGFSLFFPFLTAYACLSWGAPLTRLRPRRMLRRAVQALRPGGWLVVANQTVDEHVRLCRLLAGLPVTRIARRSLATDLAPEAWRRDGQIGSIWQRQEEVPTGKSSG